MYKKIFMKILLVLFVPPFLSYIIYLLWKLPFLFVTAIIYFILFLFSIPAGEDALSSLTDYQSKTANPNFKVENKIPQKRLNIIKIISFIVLAMAYMFIYIEKIS